MQTLTETNGVVAGSHGAAARLGMKRSTLYYYRRKNAQAFGEGEPEKRRTAISTI